MAMPQKDIADLMKENGDNLTEGDTHDDQT